jgi:UDP-glucuronate 4-epimerase
LDNFTNLFIMVSMKILLTGGAGFIGSHVTDYLLAQAHNIVAIDNFDSYYPKKLKQRNIAGAMLHPNYKFVQASFGDHEAMCELLRAEDFDAVVHLAGRPGAAFSLEDPLKYERVLVSDLLSFLEALREHGPRQILAISSCSVYGAAPLPFREDAPCLQALSPYGASKRAGEIFLTLYNRLYDFKVLIFRPFTVYGPRQRPDMAISNFARLMLRDETLRIYGDGSISRDCLYISDVAQAMAAAVQAFPSDFGVYNLGSGASVSINQLIGKLEALIGKKAKIEHMPGRRYEAAQTQADISKAAKELSFQPKVKLDEGLKLTVKWLQQESRLEATGG